MPSKNPKRVSCDKCSKTFRGLFELDRHSVQHSPDKNKLKYKCVWPGCTSSTLQKSNLRAHVEAVHLNIYGHACTIDPLNCQRIYKSASSLTVHKKKAHGHLLKKRESKAAGSSRSVIRKTKTRARRRDTPSSSSDSESSDDSGSDFERAITPSPSPVFPQSQHLQCSDYPTLSFDNNCLSFGSMGLTNSVNDPLSFGYLPDTGLAGYSMTDLTQEPFYQPPIVDMSLGQQLPYPDTIFSMPCLPGPSNQSAVTDISMRQQLFYPDTSFSSMPFNFPLEYAKIDTRDDWAAQCPEATRSTFHSCVVAGGNNFASTELSNSGISQLVNQFENPQLL